MGDIEQKFGPKHLTSDLILNDDNRPTNKLRSMNRSSSKRKAIKITLSYHSNSSCSSDNDSSYCSCRSTRSGRSCISPRYYNSSPIRCRSRSSSNDGVVSNTQRWNSPLSILLNTKLLQSFECYLSYLKPHTLNPEDFLSKEWTLPTYRNFYNFLSNYKKILIREASNLSSESFAYKFLYRAYTYFTRSLNSYIQSVINESDTSDVFYTVDNNELKRSFDFSNLDNDDIINMGRYYKRQKISLTGKLNINISSVENSQFRRLLSRIAGRNPVNMFKIPQTAMSALNRLYNMISALNLNDQLRNHPGKRIKMVRDGLLSLRFTPSLPTPQLPQLPQLQLPQLSNILSLYMNSVQNIKSIPSLEFIRLISYISSVANIRNPLSSNNNNSIDKDGSNIFEVDVDEDEKAHRFKEYISMHTAHWGEDAYDHVEVRLCSNDDIIGFGIPDTCNVM